MNGKIRAGVAALLLSTTIVLAGCATAAPVATESPTPAVLPTTPTVTRTAPNPVTPTVEAKPQPAGTATRPSSGAEAEQVVRDYFQALSTNNPAAARALLSPELQAQTSEADISSAAQALKAVTVAAMKPVDRTETRIVYEAIIIARPNPDKPSNWQDGANIRWITLTRMQAGWRIAEIATSAPANTGSTPAVTGWKQVQMPDTGMSFEVPQNWQQFGIEYAWGPPASGGPHIGVNVNDVAPGWEPTGMLPNHSQVLQSTPMDLGWAKATVYTVQLSDSAAEGGSAQGIQTHIIAIAGGKRAYDFYASGRNSDDMEMLQPILQHMVSTIVLKGG